MQLIKSTRNKDRFEEKKKKTTLVIGDLMGCMMRGSNLPKRR